MIIIENSLSLRKHVKCLQQKNQLIALVPTMGNLHDGHMRLIDEAKNYADIIITTIFINPMQFDCTDDLMNYPCTLQEDLKKLNEHYVDFVFIPSLIDIYPQDIKFTTYVEVPNISNILEGINRPGHFRGVSTIISKLFNLTQPNFAFFGEKDYQQLLLIRKMVIDMSYDIKIVSIPTVRTKDGLALSSRNSRLNAKQRRIAPNLNKIINIIAEKIMCRKDDSLEKIITYAKHELNHKGFQVDDIQIRDADNLLELKDTSKYAVILISAWLGQVRLIDNKVINWQ